MLRLISILTLLAFFFSTTITPALAAINYTYDQNGNMNSDGTNCYEYNEANQLSKVKNCSTNQAIAEYIYDYTGKRLVKKEYENGVLKQTIYSPTDEYETKKLANGTTQNTTYYKVNDEIVARKNPDGSKTYYHNDHLGSNSVLTDQNGEVVEKTTYEPFGEVKQGGTKSKFGYTGQEKDNETGLNYYDARYYDPHAYHFTQPDDITQNWYDPQSLNRYSYVKNNPIRYTDPTGHYLETALDIAFISLDLNEIRQEPTNPWNYAALGADGIGAALPLGTGFGLGVRTIQYGGDIEKATTTYIKAVDSSKNLSSATQSLKQFPQIKQGSVGGLSAGKKYISEETKNKVRLENPNKQCVYCHMPILKEHFDHAIAKSKGGNTTIKNIQLTCPHCNLSKGAGEYPKSKPNGFKGFWPPAWWGK